MTLRILSSMALLLAGVPRDPDEAPDGAEYPSDDPPWGRSWAHPRPAPAAGRGDGRDKARIAAAQAKRERRRAKRLDSARKQNNMDEVNDGK